MKITAKPRFSEIKKKISENFIGTKKTVMDRICVVAQQFSRKSSKSIKIQLNQSIMEFL